jgi:IclR family acetate operon transcriptional repressor
MKSVPASPKRPVEINGDTPTLRLFALLEVIASKDQFFSLQGLV